MDAAIKNMTAEFEDVKILMNQLSSLKKDERRIKRRLKTKQLNYTFLSDIVGLSKKDRKLTEPLFKFFKYLGINVHRAPDNDKGGVEDLRIFYADTLIIIEATSIEKGLATEGKLTQILKHIKIRQAEFPNYKVIGLSIINHEDNKHFTKRGIKQKYQDKTVKILKSHELCSVTTLTLLINFIKIKKGEITIDDFMRNLTSPGIYEI